MINWILALSLLTCSPAQIATPVVGIIVDDLGNSAHGDAAAIATAGVKTVAVLPHVWNSQVLVQMAHAQGKDVLLHLPMEAQTRNHLLGPGALMQRMNRTEFIGTVNSALAALPGVTGISNHMGSLLTQDKERMRWLMEELSRHREMIFVDSRTTPKTVAGQAASNQNIRYAERDVFLDNKLSEDYIDNKVRELLNLARSRGDAIGIAHPHRVTLEVLNRRMPQSRDVKAVTISELFRIRECRQRHRRTANASLAAMTQRDQTHEQAHSAADPNR